MTPEQEIKQRQAEERRRVKEQYNNEIQIASYGKQVIENPAYNHAFTGAKAHCFDIFCNTKKDQGDVREEAWRTMQNLFKLERFFNEVITTGKMAEESLKSLTSED